MLLDCALGDAVLVLPADTCQDASELLLDRDLGDAILVSSSGTWRGAFKLLLDRDLGDSDFVLISDTSESFSKLLLDCDLGDAQLGLSSDTQGDRDLESADLVPSSGFWGDTFKLLLDLDFGDVEFFLSSELGRDATKLLLDCEIVDGDLVLLSETWGDTFKLLLECNSEDSDLVPPSWNWVDVSKFLPHCDLKDSFSSPCDVFIFELPEAEVLCELFEVKSDLDLPLAVREEDFNFAELRLGSFKDIELAGVLGDDNDWRFNSADRSIGPFPDCPLFFLVSGVLEHSFKLEECLNASAATDESDDPRLGPFSLEGCSSTWSELFVFLNASELCVWCNFDGFRNAVSDLPICDASLIDDFFMLSFELEGDALILHLVPTIPSSATEFCGELSQL